MKFTLTKYRNRKLYIKITEDLLKEFTNKGFYIDLTGLKDLLKKGHVCEKIIIRDDELNVVRTTLLGLLILSLKDKKNESIVKILKDVEETPWIDNFNIFNATKAYKNNNTNKGRFNEIYPTEEPEAKEEVEEAEALILPKGEQNAY